MKNKIISLCTLATLSSMTAKAEGFKPSSGVEFSNPQKLGNILSVEQQAKLTESELKEIKNIDIYGDVEIKENIYYVQPVRVTKWNETRYTTNMMIQERLTNALFQLIDDKLATISPGAVSAVTDASSGTLSPENVVNGQNQLETIDKAKREALVASIKLMQALLPEPYNLLPVNDFDQALLLANDVINKVPSIRAQMSIGWGYSEQRAKAFTKVQSILADKKFYALPVKTAYVLKANKGETPALSTSNEAQKLAVVDNAKRRAFENKVFREIEGIKISNVGTVVGLDLFTPSTRGWNLVPTDARAGEGVLRIEGDFSTSFPMSVEFKGRVDCQFTGSIKKQKFFSVEQMPNTILMVDQSESRIDETKGGIVECSLYDSQGKLISSDGKVPLGAVPAELVKNEADRENIARALNAQIEGKVKQFTDETSAEWKAGTDLRDEIFRQAQEMVDGYLMLTVPTELKTRNKWETVKECRQVPRQGECKRHGWKKGHGIKNLGDKWICVEYATLFDEACENVQRLVKEAYQQPVKVRGFSKNVDFQRTFDTKKSYEVNGSAHTWFDVNSANDACLKRKAGATAAEFLSCDAFEQEDLSNRAIDRSVDEPTLPQANSAASADFQLL